MKANDRSRRPHTVALGRAIRLHRGEMSQEDLAPGLGVSQASISSWERGGVDLTCEQVAALERRVGLRRGTLFVEAGYVDERLIGAEAGLVLALARLGKAVDTLLAIASAAAKEKP